MKSIIFGSSAYETRYLKLSLDYDLSIQMFIMNWNILLR